MNTSKTEKSKSTEQVSENKVYLEGKKEFWMNDELDIQMNNNLEYFGLSSICLIEFSWYLIFSLHYFAYQIQFYQKLQKN